MYAQERLTGAKDGRFVIRDSSGNFATLTMMYEGRYYQAHIEDTPQGASQPSVAWFSFALSICGSGLHLKKSAVFKPNLSSLVEHYRQLNQSDLPIPLVVA